MTQRLLKKEETGEAGVESSKARTDPETAFSGLWQPIQRPHNSNYFTGWGGGPGGELSRD